MSFGGTSQIYRAWNKGESFALKMYTAPGLEKGILRSIFEKEVGALRSLKHDSIIELYDSGYSADDRSHFVVLEWIPRTIDEFSDEHDEDDEPPRWWDAFMPALGIPLLEALSFAHDRGVIHRDIKPTNILITDGGSPKLADFGIAKIATDSLTVSEFRSEAYTAPEGHGDEQADVYSLGVTFVELLAGSGWDPRVSNRANRIEAGIREADLHPRATDLLTRMTATDRKDRFRTAGQVLAFARNLQERRHSIDTPHRVTVHIHITNSVRSIVGPALAVDRPDKIDDAIVGDLLGFRADLAEQ